MSIPRRLRETWRRIKEISPWGTAIVASRFPRRYGAEIPEINREDFMKLYTTNSFAKAAIDMTLSDAIGIGYFTSVKYDEEAKQLCDSFAEKVNLDEIISLTTRDMLVIGDGFCERIFEDETKRKVSIENQTQQVIAPVKGAKLVNLKWLPGHTMYINRTPTGRMRWYIQATEGKKIYFAPEKIINFKWNPVGLDAYGTSLLRPVYQLLQDLEKIQDNFVKIIKRYAKPPIIWQGKGLSQTRMEELKTEIESLEPDEDLYLNTDMVTPLVLEINPRGRFEEYYQRLINTAIVGLETPTLPSLEQATLASSQAMLEFYSRKITRIRRLVKRKIEMEIFKPLIESYGREEIPRVRWNVLKTKFEIDPDFILDLVKAEIYTPWQAKQVLQSIGFPFPVEKRK